MLTIGLTGGIGSGKSTVSAEFERLGIPVIDADQLSRQLVEPEQPALQQIVRQFGEGILTANGELDRRALRDIIFRDKAARHQLESILHPAIREAMHQQLAELEAPYALLVIPLLLETGRQHYDIDRILVVDVPETLQLERVKRRDAVNDDEAAAILASQVDRQTRLAAADDIIHNDGDLTQLQQQIQQLHRRYLQLAGGN